MYCYYKWSVALPRGAVGWSEVCDCGISWSYSLTFCVPTVWKESKISIVDYLMPGFVEIVQTNLSLSQVGHLTYIAAWNVPQTMACWVIFHNFLSSADFFKINIFKKFFQEAIRVSKRLDPDQVQLYVGPDSGPNCLQMLSADANNVSLPVSDRTSYLYSSL